MKKVLVVLMSLVMVLGILCFAGCGAKKTDESVDLLDEIKARGKMIIATEGTWAPWTFHDDSNELVGFDVEVAKKVCEKLGVEAEIIEVEWDGILAGVESGRYDIAANGVEIDEDRIAKYDFTDAYAYIHTALIVKDDNEEITCFEDLNGKTTANTLQSTYAKLGEKYGATVTGVDDLAQTIELVKTGRIDATLNADVSYYDYLLQHPDSNIKMVDMTEEASHVAFPVKKNDRNKTLIEAINNALNELRAEGVLAELSVKYFGGDITAN